MPLDLRQFAFTPAAMVRPRRDEVDNLP